MNSHIKAISLTSIVTIFFLINPLSSSLNAQLVVSTSGTINGQNLSIVAKSGRAKDIQAAIDQIAPLGTGIVYIPEGVWDFCEVGETWKSVQVPAGINIIGAGLYEPDLVYDSTNQSSNWKTKLIMPYNAPQRCQWFVINMGDKPTRISGLAFIDYSEFDLTNINVSFPITIYGVTNFRVDHCLFSNTGYGIKAVGVRYVRDICSGVIDHCKFMNTHGDPHSSTGNYEAGGNVYGVNFAPSHDGPWRSLDDILGKYTNQTCFVEDCYFQRWRHCVNVNNCGHLVFRHNVINLDSGFGSVCAHGADVGDLKWGSRLLEVYNNHFYHCYKWEDTQAFKLRSGAAMIFNNYIEGIPQTHGYRIAYLFKMEGLNSPNNETWTKDVYIWNNTLVNVEEPIHIGYEFPDQKGYFQEGVNYFLYEKPNYVPYPYPLIL